MDQLRGIERAVPLILDHYDGSVGVLYITGCYCILYAKGHWDPPTHGYTLELIIDMIDDRLSEVQSQSFDTFEGSLLDTDVVIDDNVRAFFETMRQEQFKHVIGEIIDECHAKDATADLLTGLYGVDYDKYIHRYAGVL
jgi:hypothetical protein